MENKYKYTLIISQYYHSYHYFLVKCNEETLINQMQDLTLELDKYKGNGEQDRHIYNSDPFYSAKGDIRQRYNVNGNGDIYFINSTHANYLQEFIQKTISETKYSRKGFKKKVILDNIAKNHNYSEVAKIIEKHFKIA